MIEKSIIYLDNAATTYPKPTSVYDTVNKAFQEYGVNTGRGTYSLAVKASQIVDETRQLVADLVNLGKPENVVIFPSATIALNTVINGIDWKARDTVYYSPFEHNSVWRPLVNLSRDFNLSLEQLPVDRESLIFDLEKTAKLFEIKPPRLVVVSHASNVCGVIAPIKELTILAHQAGAEVLVDGAQTLGAIDVDISDIECDYYVFAGHKSLYGPIGIGGLIVNSQTKLKPLIYGGTGFQSESYDMPDEYPARLEAGSHNILAIAGLNAGIKYLEQHDDNSKKLHNRLISILKEFPEVKIWGGDTIKNRVPVVSCSFESYSPVEMAMVLDQRFGIAVRAGLHCSPIAHKFLGSFPEGTVRISLSRFNTINDLEYLKDALITIYS